MGTFSRRQSGLLTEIVGQSIAANILELHFLVLLRVWPFLSFCDVRYSRARVQTLLRVHDLLVKNVVLVGDFRCIPVVFESHSHHE